MLYKLNKNFNDFQPRIKDVNEVINIVDNKKKLNVYFVIILLVEVVMNNICYNLMKTFV